MQDPEGIDALLRLFARLIERDSTVVEVSPERGLVVVEQGGTVHRLHADRAVLARALAADDPALGGPGVDRVEAAARLMSVHLEESLATREPHPSGCWTYDGGGFDARPPWVRGPQAQD